MTQHWTLTRTEPAPQAALMERVLFIEILAWYAAIGWRAVPTPRAGWPQERR
jgi:hypothetical protein